MKTYCAIIGDMNKSRSLPHRGTVQRKFAGSVSKINAEFSSAIASQFLITLGDEFQGLLTTPAESYQLVRRFRDLMQPVPFAFGVGIGTLSTPLRKDAAIGMDGEAFYHARRALDEAKHQKTPLRYSYDLESVRLVNALVALMDRQWLRLTPRQKQIAQLLKDHTAKEVARRLHISPQAVSKAGLSAAAKELDEAAGSLREFLAQLTQP